ncbi:AAA family ATPase [Azospirillum sp.]|uniref:AAA family ATPase n=1 Tax=Azospirillum sp. TaxID=34012 RepID=UPI003D759BCD
MMAAAGFQVQDVLYRGTLVTVLRARRAGDGAPVVLKRLERPRPGTADVPHFRREAEIARRLAGPGIVAVDGVEDSPEGLILVMPDSGGASLDRLLEGGRLGVPEALRIGIAVASALGRVHAAGMIHKDVTPANIVWNQATGTVELIDFGIAAELARESAAPADVRTLEGTVAYMAPEQTGRMNRSVDWRADFYGLGATLYRLLTGRPPFGDADPLGVVHGHIARTPPTPHALEYGVPTAVSAIVMKLLAKDPEARYQSAAGLIADLEACAAALEAGEQPKLVLGRHDRSERFAIPETLYGREAEVAALLASFGRVVEGRAELLLIAGPAGIGKSALVREVQKPMTALRGFFVEGKFDQIKRTIPYSAVIQAFDALARQLLAGSEAELAERAQAVRRAVGSNGAVVTELIPAFALLLGEQPPVPELAPSEAEFRFQLTFQNLVAALTGPERPLVLFLDDLQWADRPSLALLERLIADPDMKHLLVIGACRDDDSDAAAVAALARRLKDDGCPVERLRVGPLTATDVRRLVAETTRRDDGRVDELAALCRAKTQGNPFFLGQFLLAMHEEGLIAFDRAPGLWTWDAARIAQRDSTDNVVDLMVEKIRRLAPATRATLSIAACVGGRFELADLAAAGDAPAAELAAALVPALREGLVLPLDGAYRTVAAATADGAGPKVRYRFLHDRVQQAAYSLIPEGERAAVHLRTGRRLLSGTPDPERSEDLFDILDHLNRAHALIGDVVERLRIAALNLAAARRALASGASEPAFGYGRAGLALLGDAPWGTDHALALALHEETADAAGVCGEAEMMERLCADALAHARAPRETIRAHLIRVTALVARGEVAEATEAGLAALRSLGVTLPERGSRLAAVATLLRGRLMLARHAAASKAPLPLRERGWGEGGSGRQAANDSVSGSASRNDPLPNPSPLKGEGLYGGADLKALARLVFVVFGGVLYARKDMAVPIAFRAVELALRSGDPAMRVVALSAWVTLCSFAGAWRDAVKHSPCVDEVLAAEGFGVTPRVVFGFLAFGWHWAEPIPALRPRFRAAYEQALVVGDREGAGYHLLQWLRCGWLTGERLPDFAEDTAEVKRLLQRIGNTLQAKVLTLFEQATAILLEGSAQPSRLHGAHMDEDATLAEMEATRNVLMLANVHLMKLHLAVVFGTPDATRIATALTRHLDQIRATTNYPLALLLLALADPARLPHARRRFRTLAALGPRNHRHRLLLLDAEHLRRRGRVTAAERAYDAAIAAARENGFVGEEAIANERAAAFYEERGRDTPALAYRAQARDGYERWGATAKVRELERRHPALLRVWPGAGPLSGTYTTSTVRDAGGLDVAAILRAAEAISGEIRRDALLGTLMRTVLETAGAVRGVLLMGPADGALHVAAEGDAERAAYRALPPEPLEASAEARAPASLVAYVTRTREPLVLADAAEDPRFAGDAYVDGRATRSVLCLPLLRQGALVGVLYLENDLTRAAFVAERLEAPRLLAAQIAAALENARLYDELNALTRELEFQVAERTRELRTQSQRLQATLASMSDALAVFDADHRLRVWNRRAEAIFPSLAFREGLRYEDMLSALVGEGTIRADLPFAFEAGPEEMDLSDGRIIQVRRNVMPDGGMVRVYLDVTEDRRRERELRAANEQLVTAQTQLVQSEKLASLGQLVAGVAHEINSPLGVALTGASFLAGETERIKAAAGGGTLKRSEFQQFITDAEEISALLTSNIARAAELVQSFKQVAVDQTSDDRRRFALKPRLDEIVFSLSPTWKKPGHRVELDCPEGIEVDGYPGVLAQIVTNLVVNSVTHAYPPGRTGVMRLSVTRPQLGWVELTYTDDGRGIPEEHRAKVFDPFFTTRRGAGSTGLGLHIVFNLVTAKLGGSIRLDAAEGGGTRFTLRFPAMAPAEAALA